MITAADLISTVRGRRLCYELAGRGPVGTSVHAAKFGAAMRVHEERGDIGGAVSWAYSGSGKPATIPTAPFGPPLDDALTAAARAALPPETLLPALSDTVRSAMYWQPPAAEDVVLADPAISARLLPIAEAVLAAPGAQWWSSPLDRGAQVRTTFEPTPTQAHPGETPTDRLRRWRETVLDGERRFAQLRAAHPDTRVGGTWWVTPELAGLTATTRSLTEGSAALWLTEDELGWESARLVPCTVDEGARVLEIAGPQDWAALVAAYPLDVTASRQPDWFGAVDARDGSWLIPDWPAVAEEFDGVHVSVLGWLTTSGQAVPVDPRATTTLAGWGPDATWWLADVLHAPGAGRRWVRDEGVWRTFDPASG